MSVPGMKARLAGLRTSEFPSSLDTADRPGVGTWLARGWADAVVASVIARVVSVIVAFQRVGM